MNRRDLIWNGQYVYYVDMILPHMRLAGHVRQGLQGLRPVGDRPADRELLLRHHQARVRPGDGAAEDLLRRRVPAVLGRRGPPSVEVPLAVAGAVLGKLDYDVLNVVALKKMATATTIAEASGRARTEIDEVLTGLSDQGLVVVAGDAALPTDAGRTRPAGQRRAAVRRRPRRRGRDGAGGAVRGGQRAVPAHDVGLAAGRRRADTRSPTTTPTPSTTARSSTGWTAWCSG